MTSSPADVTDSPGCDRLPPREWGHVAAGNGGIRRGDQGLLVVRDTTRGER